MKSMDYEISDGIYITSETVEDAGSFPAFHSHNVYEIYIMVSGERYMSIGNSVYRTAAGDAAVIPPHTPHRSRGEMSYTGVCVEFSDRYLNENFGEAEQRMIRGLFRRRVVPLGEKEAARLLGIAGTAEPRKYLLELSKLLSEAGGAERTDTAESDLSPIGCYIQEHYTEIKGLASLADRFGISKSYLCRIFKKHTGMTVTEYMNRLKVQHALKLLQETDMRINEISSRAGFESVIYFNRVFRRIEGMTPKEARRSSREKWNFKGEG